MAEKKNTSTKKNTENKSTKKTTNTKNTTKKTTTKSTTTPKKKNGSANSKVKKVEEIEVLDKTNSFDIIIDDERLKDKESLDFSFIDGKRKKKKAKKEIEILEEVDYKEELKNIDIPKKEKNGSDAFSTSLLIIFSFVFGFLICFIWAKESDYFTVVEKEKEEVVKTEIIVDDNYLFVGDSITARYDLDEYFKGMPVINSGIGGNKTTDILNDMNDRIYRYNPSKVILLIGTNDYSRLSNSDTVKNIGKIIDGIKDNREYADIYVQSIYPVNKEISKSTVGDRNNEDISEMNSDIKKLCKEKSVSYINMYDLLVDDDGNLDDDYTKDGLHLDSDGYEVVTEEIMKILKK
ncbi:MAG: hypothetical protein IJA30_02050 [Bacilli bacterium]|nr:hypothetical protein [Bacilli bacterium]